MKVIWDYKKITAIPVSNISCFEIETTDEWRKGPREDWKEIWEGKRYYVIARYTICTGTSAIVFTADTKEKCIDFIENI